MNFTARYDFDLDVYRNAYRDQVAFINTKLIEMVDRIQQSHRQSLIIIQADHGPRLGFGSKPNPILKEEENNARHHEAYAILNAIRVPDGLQPEFYSEMTPVNTFRLIFNELLGTQFQLEPDYSYFEEHYVFENVTDKTSAQSLRNAVTKTNLTNER